MNMPSLIQRLYGTITFTGLYSFEFVDKNRNTITEIFFMMPPKSKTTSESTRSSTVPTLSGNYNVDGGNSTKEINLSGKLYFPYVGSPDNPVARDNIGLDNTLNGLEELMKLRWMLIRYRDYTLTSNAKITVPISILPVSKEINILYRKIASKLKNKTGALYDEIKLIYHDYDDDDHYYVRVDNFSKTQSDSNYIAADYSIQLEGFEPADFSRNPNPSQNRRSTNESIDIINTQISQIDFDSSLTSIQTEIGYNSSFTNAVLNISENLSQISIENENIQAGKSTANSILPTLIATIFNDLETSFSDFLNTFLSISQKELYDSGDLTLDEIVSQDLVSFYNSLQKVKIQIESLSGVLNSLVKLDEIRYNSNSDNYTLTEEQFSDESSKVENTTNFFYYTILEGDTARIIAQRELKDQELFINILQLNDISENDFIDNNLVGEKIKIPFPLSVTSRGEDNLVYESDYNNSEKFLFGSDLSLGINNEIKISETGDIFSVEGIENAFSNIESRLNNNRGSLNVFHPTWGTVPIDDGNTPFLVKIDRYLTDVVTQIQADPRVESAQMDLDKLELKDERISVPIKIFFIGTEQTKEVIANG